MKRLQQQTLLGIRDQFGSYAWEDAEISELVDPQLGIITGFQELLDELELPQNPKTPKFQKLLI